MVHNKYKYKNSGFKDRSWVVSDSDRKVASA
jgi:hypothetical protein